MDYTLDQITEIIGGRRTGGDGEARITGAAPFEIAEKSQITLAGSPKYVKRLANVRAGAVIAPKGVQSDAVPVIGVDAPQAAFAKVLALFHPRPPVTVQRHPTAVVSESAWLGRDVHLSPHVCIGDDAVIGDRVRLHAGVIIEAGAAVGDDTEIYPRVVVRERCRIGNRVIIQPGTVIGGDGFGFAPDGERYVKIPHTGIVQIDDDVEIGSLNAIDRGTFGKTWIQKGVKTDNLVHIAHNVTVGENTLLVAQVGISGSSAVGKHAILAGQAGVSGHLTIGDNAVVGPQAGIARSVPDGEVVSGSPEIPHKLWLRVQRIIPMLPDLKKKIAELEKRLKKVEEDGCENHE